MDIGETSKKRRHSDADDLPQAKIACIEDNALAYSTNLLDLSDEIWLAIFRHLDSETLYSLGKCCSRLRSFIEEKTFWVRVDFKAKPLQANQILKRLKFLHTDTKSLALRGMYSFYPLDKYKNITITQNMLNNIRDNCPQLEYLEIVEGFLDIDKISIQNFPESLKELKFTKCSTKVNARDAAKSPFFSKIDKQLQCLEHLTLEECHFFDTHDLMSFSKIVNLKKLSLKGCTSLKDCVPYGSIATRFGFKKLEILDIRDTPVSDSDIQSFNMTKTLRELLMECPVGYRDDAASNENSETNAPSTSRRFLNRRASAEPEVGQSNGGTAAENETCEDQEQPPVVDNETSSDDDEEEEEEEANEALAAVAEEPNNQPANDLPQRLQPSVRIIVEGVQQLPDNENGEAGRAAEGNGNAPDEERNDLPNFEQPPAPQQNNFGHADHQNIIHVVIHEHPEDMAQQRQAGAPGVERHDIFFNAGPGPDERPGGEVRPGIRLIRNPHQAGGFRQNHIIFVRRNNDGMAVNDDFLRPIPNIQNRYAPIAGYLRLENNLPYYQFDPPTKPLISDRGICSFGMSRNNVQQGVIWIRAEHRQPDTYLERIIVRHYKQVTDASLRHLSTCSPKLKFIDLTGTSVTESGIEQFKITKPECIVVSNFSPNNT